MSSINNNATPVEARQGSDLDNPAFQILIETINRKITEGTQNAESMSSVCIYRVPKELRKLKESAYTPRLISIGPLHRKDMKRLNPQMQDIKMSYVNSLLCRASDGSEERKFGVLKECVGKMREFIDNAKKCYAEEVSELDEEMLVIDGCFILELLYRNFHFLLDTVYGDPQTNSNQSSSDPIFGFTLTLNNVQHDMLLLENQLPFFVLEELYSLTVACTPNHRPLNGYVLFFFHDMLNLGVLDSNSSNAKNCCSAGGCGFGCVIPFLNFFRNVTNFEGGGNPAAPQTRTLYPSGKFNHILHLLHALYLPPGLPKEGRLVKFMHSASDLDYAGVKFVAGTGRDIFQVKFNKSPGGRFRWFRRAHFEIPTLSIYDSTEVFLRNFIAFEQCFPGVSSYVTSYAFLMDTLINNEKDVEVLEKAGVIRNYLGAKEEASDLFNNLCKEIDVGEFFFAQQYNGAAEYSQQCWSAAMAHLRRKYFATPWTFIAFCAAFVIFGISVAQFILSFV